MFDLYPQNAPVTRAPEINTPAGMYFEAPIRVKDFNDISALSLTLFYDSNVLIYQSYTNSSDFPGLIIFEPISGEIRAAAFVPQGNPPVTLNDDAILFTLHFYCISNTATEFTWFDDGESCEYADGANNTLVDSPTSLFYKDGYVNQSFVSIGLKVFLEGAFANNEMKTFLNDAGLMPVAQPYFTAPWSYDGEETVFSLPQNAVDWVWVQLRETSAGPSTATADKIIASRAGFLMKNGSVKDIDGISNLRFPVTVSANLFIAIYHRNHIAVLSSTPVSLLNGSGYYDFTSAENKVFGGSNGYKQISPFVWGMAAGDGNSDGHIDDSDIQYYWNVAAGSAGYLNSDFSFDAQVSNCDKNDFWNPNRGLSKQIPD